VSEGARLVVADESGAVVHEEPLEPFHEESGKLIRLAPPMSTRATTERKRLAPQS
jgi:hypothetical protein